MITPVVLCADNQIQKYMILTASNDIDKGMIIQEMNVDKAEYYTNHNIATDIDQVIGKRTKKAIRAKQPIYIKYLEADYHVKKNTMIHVIYNKNGVSIRTKCLALENGNIGDYIQVQYDNKNINHVKITDKNQTEIF